uniref:MASE1 domain-containing protein n=1 Tax=Mycena chlorophos TaxID=658473 RepID=A0ABQ0KXS0_MYCCL|nr:predicted protein [Mycena chlorophos]
MVDSTKTRQSTSASEQEVRFTDFLTLCGISFADFAREAGFSYQRCRNWFWRDPPQVPAKPDVQRAIQAIADKFRVSAPHTDWFNFGIGPAPRRIDGEASLVPSRNVAPGRFKLATGVVRVSYLETFSKESTPFVDIPSSLLHEDISLTVPSVRGFINPTDAMRGEIEKGDLCFVDTALREVAAEGIYAYKLGGVAMVRKIQIRGKDALRIQGTKPHEDALDLEGDELQDLEIGAVAPVMRIGDRMLKVTAKDCILVFGYALLFYGCRSLSVSHWLLSTGLRFGALILLPPRTWPFLIGADLLGSMSWHGDMISEFGIQWFVLTAMCPSLLAALPAGSIWLMNRQGSSPSLASSITRSLNASAVLSILTASVNLLALESIPKAAAPVLPAPVAAFGVYMLGNFLGCLMTVPWVTMVNIARRSDLASLRSDFYTIGGQSLKPVLGAVMMIVSLALANTFNKGDHAYVVTAILMIGVIVWCTMQNGWFAAAPLTLAANIALRILIKDVRNADLLTAQVLVAICSAIALVMGAAVTELKVRSQRFEQDSKEQKKIARGNLSLGEARIRRAAVALEQAYTRVVTTPVLHAVHQRSYAATAEESAALRWSVGVEPPAQMDSSIKAISRDRLDLRGLKLSLSSGEMLRHLQEADIYYSPRISSDANGLPSEMQSAIYTAHFEVISIFAHQFTPSRISVHLRVFGKKPHRSAVLMIKAWPAKKSVRDVPGPYITIDQLRGMATSFDGLLHSRMAAEHPYISVLLREG